MTPVVKDDKLVNSRKMGANARFAAIDVTIRSAAAAEQYSDQFEAPAHNTKVDAARAIIDGYFKIADVYENSRGNRGKPFTVIKISNHVWPKVSFAEKDRRLKTPLAELGLEILPTAANALLVRIYCAE